MIEFSQTILLRKRSVDVCEIGALSFAGRELQTLFLFSAFLTFGLHLAQQLQMDEVDKIAQFLEG